MTNRNAATNINHALGKTATNASNIGATPLIPSRTSWQMASPQALTAQLTDHVRSQPPSAAHRAFHPAGTNNLQHRRSLPNPSGQQQFVPSRSTDNHAINTRPLQARSDASSGRSNGIRVGGGNGPTYRPMSAAYVHPDNDIPVISRPSSHQVGRSASTNYQLNDLSRFRHQGHVNVLRAEDLNHSKIRR